MQDAPETLPHGPDELSAAAPVLNYSSPVASEFPPGWTNITVYGLDLAAVGREWERRLLLVLALRVPIPLLMIGVLVWMLRGEPHVMVPFAAAMLCFFGASQTLNLVRARRRFYQQWPTYRLVMADQGILRTCQDFDDLQLPVETIRQVREIRTGLMILGAQKRLAIYVPRSLQDYAQIREKLALLRPISSARWLTAGRLAFSLLISILFLAAFYWGMITGVPWQQFACLAITIAIAAWNIWTVMRNPNATRYQRPRSLLSILLPGYLALKIFIFHRFFR